jgi:two-component system OmpR family sensor kinase
MSARLKLWLSLIRTRLTLWIIVILAVGMFAFVVTTLLIANSLLQNLNEKRLRQNVASLSVVLAQESGTSFALISDQLNAFSVSEIYLQYQDQQGKPLASSRNLGKVILPLSQLRRVIATNTVQSTTIGNNPALIYGQAITSHGKLQGYLLSAYISGDNDLNEIFTLMYSGVFVTLTFIALLVWLLIRQTLRPLEHLADAASHIAMTSDHALRLQAEGRPDEINSLTQTINGMLQSLEDAYRDMQNVNDLQRRFLADVSHELRTPLTIMLSSLDLMKKEQGRDPEFQADALENIHLEAERMARLVTRLLMLARTDVGAPFAREPLLFIDIINEAYRQGRPLAGKIVMDCQGLETLEDAVVFGNADYLKQVFLIILENACKYSSDSGKVSIIGTIKEHQLAITIADSGIGIAQSDLPKLFQRFYRAANAHDLPGMGLGLSIARGIIEQHDGQITVESVLGQGSRFTVFLPLLSG